MTTLKIPTGRVFLPLLKPARYKGAWGGRGSGKSHFFAAMAVRRCVEVPGFRILCVREVQKSLRDSAKRLIEDKIREFNVPGFEILDKVIRTPGGGEINFVGMQDHTAESIKSLEGYDVAWVEEARSLSPTSLRLLRPTIRKPGSELWFSWNPKLKTDPVDQLLRGPDLPPDAVVVQANWSDNHWFPKELDAERQFDLLNAPDQYAHVWEGDYAAVTEGAYYARIRVMPVDSEADPETAEVLNGLIRNIEQASNAEVAYDTALEHAVFGGFGYFRINTRYASDDTFDQDIVIERVPNPLAVYPDCYATGADSADWNYCYVTDNMTKAAFQKAYPGATEVDWQGEAWKGVGAPWMDGDYVQVAEYWVREKVNYGAEATAAAMASWQQYRDAKAELEGAIAKTETDFRQISERSTANAIAQAEQVLSREIEGWSPQLVTTLAGYAAENFGITPQELRDSVVNPDGTADPRTFKVLARLHAAETELAQLKAQTQKAQQAAKQASVTPAKAVGQRAGGYKPGLDDSLPADEWLRRRNAQLAKAGAR